MDLVPANIQLGSILVPAYVQTRTLWFAIWFHFGSIFLPIKFQWSFIFIPFSFYFDNILVSFWFYFGSILVSLKFWNILVPFYVVPDFCSIFVPFLFHWIQFGPSSFLIIFWTYGLILMTFTVKNFEYSRAFFYFWWMQNL